MKKLFTATALLAMAASAASAETPEFRLSIKDHKFAPATLEIPADTKVKIVVKNEDATPEEFESHDLNREKVIAAKGEAALFVGPLSAGEYKFFGEYHEDTAKGSLIVK